MTIKPKTIVMSSALAPCRFRPQHPCLGGAAQHEAGMCMPQFMLAIVAAKGRVSAIAAGTLMPMTSSILDVQTRAGPAGWLQHIGAAPNMSSPQNCAGCVRTHALCMHFASVRPRVSPPFTTSFNQHSARFFAKSGS